ncbi:MAG: asparagine synthase (glutamine-hydrolyzing) [Bacteroidia bacterium]|nr:asparagine synthase (glutamine-hydrolyzing) [Bacteroidia bacterium]GIV23386.1 MAG: asparagine synthetase B [Bacteroidia bacterium]
MCGVAGYFLWGEAEPPDLHVALHLLAHRGPDAARTWQSPPGSVGLAHTRLSILDLSEAAHQPLHLGATHLVYNGEIYNFRELAQEGGFPLTTRSDTEVILHAYHRWGEKAWEKLEGMFAFALYDEGEQVLFLVRDPLGIKPLWVAETAYGLYFASELKVLKAWLKPLSHRPEALAEFLHLGFIPAPHSWYQHIYKVLPGEVWQVRPHRVEKRFYYDRTRLWQQPLLSLPQPEIEALLAEKLRRAVRAHLVSDVPVGLFLSGGTDSSLVAAFAAEEGHKLQAFSIGFAEASYNELPYACEVARILSLPFTEAILSAKEALTLIPRLPEWFDEPFGDVSALPTYLVSRLASQSVKVVLAGDGGDELFWGYGRYRWALRLARAPSFWRTGGQLLRWWPQSRAQRVRKLLALPTSALPEHIFSQEEYAFSWGELHQLWADTPTEPWHTPFTLPSTLPEAQAAWDFLHYLPDDLLTKVDRASMQHSLEVRVPLLDKTWVELAWRVPPSLKKPLPGAPPQYKPLLRALLKRFLPASLVERKKWGFTLPLAQWLQGPLADWARTYAHPTHLYQAYGLNPPEVRALWRKFEAGQTYLAGRLWLLAQAGVYAEREATTLPRCPAGAK